MKLMGWGIVYLAAMASAVLSAEHEGWFEFHPPWDNAPGQSVIDLRFLNESKAGENGFIGPKQGRLIHTKTQEPVRFWAVNGPPHDLKGEPLQSCARLLAKYGINLVRLHHGYFDAKGDVDMAKVHHAFEVVTAMKAEGIYSYFSIYFPLWLKPAPDHPWLQGYSGQQPPFAALFFNEAFQRQYRGWWTALLTTPDPLTGQRLINEPAVAGLEIQNEDSLFFWTFSERNIPAAQLESMEEQFGKWLTQKYGSLDAALSRWNGMRTPRDQPTLGRMGFRPLWNIFHERTRRDQDTAQFLFEVQERFYREIYGFLRGLGFQGVISASNWSTASPEYFGPLEKMSYTVTDLVDRHGYFSCRHQGSSAEWSIRPGHTYCDRSALRFEAESADRSKQFVHPVMDPHYDDKPSMISETTWNRPNRFRSEAPLYLAAYGALQDSDAIVHFAFDSMHWMVKPGYWMQPWTLMSPAMLAQFPAAALIYRRGLIREAEIIAEVRLNRQDTLALKGTPLPQDAALDELRQKDVPLQREPRTGERLDPLLHYVGRSRVTFQSAPAQVTMLDLTPFIDRGNQTVRSSTSELKLDYGHGVLVLNAPGAQGVSGALGRAGLVQLHDLTIASDLELGHIIAVSLDQRPLASSSRILLQVMSEEKTSGFVTESVSPGVHRITSIGQDPWLVRELNGTVQFNRPDAGRLTVRALDLNGHPGALLQGGAQHIALQPKTLYYLISQ